MTTIDLDGPPSFSFDREDGAPNFEESQVWTPEMVETLASLLAEAAAENDRLCDDVHPTVELLEARHAIDTASLSVQNLLDALREGDAGGD
jgi:hypothetical protein